MRYNIRFCKQRDHYSCGPIALLNAAKFFAYNVTYKDLKTFQDLVSCTSPRGTYTRNISKVLGRASRKSWKNTKAALNNCQHCLIIQSYNPETNCGHISLLCRDYYGSYILVNHYKDQKYAALIINWQQAYWIWRKATRLWYVNCDKCYEYMENVWLNLL